MFKKGVVVALAMATAVSLSGCNTPQGQAAGGGAIIGGATGALIGGALTNRPGGALIGGLTGAAAGAMIGSASAAPNDSGYAPPPRRCAEFYYDYYGNRVCRAYY